MQAAAAVRAPFVARPAGAAAARHCAARQAVVVQAAARVDNKQLLEVAQRAADAGAKVGGWGAPDCQHRKRRQPALAAAGLAAVHQAAAPVLPPASTTLLPEPDSLLLPPPPPLLLPACLPADYLGGSGQAAQCAVQGCNRPCNRH
jgi:hypothetical protein